MNAAEINAAIARAPKTTGQMIANRRAWLLRQEFNALRTQHGVSAVALADFLGAGRAYMVRVEAGEEAVTASMISALRAMVAA